MKYYECHICLVFFSSLSFHFLLHTIRIMSQVQLLRHLTTEENNVCGKYYEVEVECKNLDPTIVPELKLEEAVSAIRTGITNATGPIVLAATLYNTPSSFVCRRLKTQSLITLDRWQLSSGIATRAARRALPSRQYGLSVKCRPAAMRARADGRKVRLPYRFLLAIAGSPTPVVHFMSCI